MSDDGEPSGTAGRPIMNVMRHANISDAIIIVVRYFGGIKLGAAGLVRAYTQATQLALEQVAMQQCVQQLSLCLELDFAREQVLRHWLNAHKAELVSLNYAESVNVCILMAVDLEQEFRAFAGANAITVRSD